MLRILKSTNVFESFAHAFLLLFWLFSARLSISMLSYTEVKNNKYTQILNWYNKDDDF